MKFASVSAVALALTVSLLAGSAFADGDAAKGEKKFKSKCKSCHTYEQGDKHKVGPNLFGVYGRTAGSTDFGKYEALSADDGVWDDANLDKWLSDPKKYNGKKSKMVVKTKKEKDRLNIIAFLKTLK